MLSKLLAGAIVAPKKQTAVHRGCVLDWCHWFDLCRGWSSGWGLVVLIVLCTSL